MQVNVIITSKFDFRFIFPVFTAQNALCVQCTLNESTLNWALTHTKSENYSLGTTFILKNSMLKHILLE